MVKKYILEVRGVDIGYGDKVIVGGINFNLLYGKNIGILGQNGIGKSTLLKSLAGFLPVKGGEVYLRGKRVAARGFNEEVNRRKIGFIFQMSSLFPHMTVGENIGYGVKTRDSRERREKIAYWLDLVDMKDYIQKYPYELSMGQMQKVSIIRTIASKSDIILMDEPFASIDSQMRESLSHQVFKVLKEENISSIFITHHKLEALSYADYIGIIDQKKLVSYENVKNIFKNPNQEVMKYLSKGCIIHRNDLRKLGLKEKKETQFFIRYNDITMGNGKLYAKVCKRINLNNKYFYCLEVLNCESIRNNLHIEEKQYYNESEVIALNLENLIQLSM